MEATKRQIVRKDLSYFQTLEPTLKLDLDE